MTLVSVVDYSVGATAAGAALGRCITARRREPAGRYHSGVMLCWALTVLFWSPATHAVTAHSSAALVRSVGSVTQVCSAGLCAMLAASLRCPGRVHVERRITTALVSVVVALLVIHVLPGTSARIAGSMLWAASVTAGYGAFTLLGLGMRREERNRLLRSGLLLATTAAALGIIDAAFRAAAVLSWSSHADTSMLWIRVSVTVVAMGALVAALAGIGPAVAPSMETAATSWTARWVARWWHWRLRWLWRMLTRHVPAVRLPVDPRGVHQKLLRRLVEIRDAQLELAVHTPADLDDAIDLIAVRNHLTPHDTRVLCEAALIAGGIEHHDISPARAPRVPFEYADLIAEARWLAQVDRMLRHSSLVGQVTAQAAITGRMEGPAVRTQTTDSTDAARPHNALGVHRSKRRIDP